MGFAGRLHHSNFSSTSLTQMLSTVNASKKSSARSARPNDFLMLTRLLKKFLITYVFSEDHKVIARQYLITGIIMALVGTTLSVLFRIQLAYPEHPFPLLHALLGRFAPGGILDPEFYLSLVTIHGTIMVFFVLTAGLSGTFSNLLIPLQLGARDMASPFLNMLSYWFFFISCVIMLSSFLIQKGPAGAGWTIYPPLSALPRAMAGSGEGITVWIISIVFFVASQMMATINYISTILNMRTRGMNLWKMPLTVWALLLTAILSMLTFPVLLGALVLLFFDRSMGTSFYLSNIILQGHIMPFEGGSPILFEHLFWFLGHPEVYIVIMPAFGIVSEIISVNSRKPIFGYRYMVYALMAITFLSFIVWGHHMFVSGMSPFLGSVFMLTTLMIAVPSAIKTFNWITTLWRGNIRFTPAMLFCIGFVSVFITGGLTGIFVGNSVLDINLNDTYFVVAHFHFVMGVASIFGMIAGAYHWFPKMFGRMMDDELGYLHFWVTFVCAYLVFFPMHFMGLDGVPRRYYSFTEVRMFSKWIPANVFISWAAFIGAGAQLIFVYNFARSAFIGKKAMQNPWQANTLEWTTPILPPHNNWPGEIPAVYRWPYDYSKPGEEEDFIPQTVPYAETRNSNLPEENNLIGVGAEKTAH
jgi:cytochrome c oxidase subunit 1